MEHLLGHIVLHSDNEVPPHTRGTLSLIDSKQNFFRITPACGEHKISAFVPKSTLGSPSHTQGTLHSSNSWNLLTGITPAYAGNTDIKLEDAMLNQDHPRLRGEHIYLIISNILQSAGSPPLTRGTLHDRLPIGVIKGITPAYAGNTVAVLSKLYVPWDHPRLRGEHAVGMAIYVNFSGSPPHTRGTPKYHEESTDTRGITPAYAGNTFRHQIALTEYKDHPRIRGEHLKFCFAILCISGITPAYARNTYCHCRQYRPSWDHPRLRGEHYFSLCCISCCIGSPPHTRGTLTHTATKALQSGITPAYAGNTYTYRY